MSAADFVALQAGVKRTVRGVSASRGVVNPMVGEWKAGWREIGSIRIFARSRAEANYGRYLQWQVERNLIAAWAHEKTTFWFEKVKRGVRSYLVDFDVTLLNGAVEHHEVKGWLDPKSKTKLRRMALYYPNIVVRLIDSKAMGALARQVGKLIPGWE